MAKLILLMGAPGSGKSTFAKTYVAPNDVYVSRDEIRFSLLKPNEEYFSHEKQVFRKFVGMINKALDEGKTVWADATHLNKASRAKLLIPIQNKSKIDIQIVWLKTSLDECVKRNEKRRGTRSYVPVDAINDMYRHLVKPEFCEGFSTIYIVEEGKPIRVYTQKGAQR